MATMSWKQAKNAVTLNFSEKFEKSFAFSIKPIAVFNVLYKRFMEAELGGDTHTLSEYCNYLSCARVPSVD